MQQIVLYSAHARSAMSDTASDGAAAPFLADLAAIGFLRREGTGFVWAAAGQEADRRLLQLIERHDLRVTLLPVAGACLALMSAPVKVGSDEEVSTFTGKGFDPADAVRRCLGEFAEFTSWVYDPQRDHARISAAPAGRALSSGPALLDLDAAAQTDRAVADAVGWCLVEPLGSAAAALWCPAALAFGRYAGPVEARTGAGLDSSGCAAGRTLDEAQRRGLLEVIERDATGLWWHGGLARPEVLPERAPLHLARALAEHEAETGRPCRFLDLTTDIGVPVVAAVSAEPDSTLPALGIACRPKLGAAMEAAHLEMVQSELAIAALMQRSEEPDAALAPEDRDVLAWYGRVDLASAPWLVPHGVPAPDHAALPDGEGALAACLARLDACGLQAYAIDLTRAETGIPAARIIVPGAAHFRRRQGMGRLTRLPAAMGWRSLLPEPGLNPLPLLI